MNTVDVLILGGGPAGLVTAMELRRLGMSVVVAEATHLLTTKLGETLSSQAMYLLQQLGLVEEFQSQGHIPAQAIRSCWGSSDLVDQLAMFDAYGPSWHLDRSCFDGMLLEHARHRGVEILLGTRVLHTQRHEQDWITQLDASGKRYSLNSTYLVDATGRGALLSGRLSIRNQYLDQLVGVSRIFSANGPEEPWTLVEATETGWWYSCPIPNLDPNGERGIAATILAVFMTDADLLGPIRELDEQWKNWVEQSEHTQSRLRGQQPTSQLHIQLARSCCSFSQCEENWLPVGDAALAFDPLAGQGLKLALETGIAAAFAIYECHYGGGPALDRYRQSIAVSWSNYLEQRTKVYRRESRWPLSKFWMRRHSSHPTCRSQGHCSKG